MAHFLKEKHLEAIHTFLQWRDTFVSLPTVVRKVIDMDFCLGCLTSLKVSDINFKLAARVVILLYLGTTGSIVVVITPLVSHMMDQKAKFLTAGVSTCRRSTDRQRCNRESNF